MVSQQHRRSRLTTVGVVFAGLLAYQLHAPSAAAVDSATEVDVNEREDMSKPQPIPSDALKLLQDNCLDCHDGDDGEGGFNLHRLHNENLATLGDRKTLQHWIRVFDRIKDGEMPPPEAGEMDQDSKHRFLDQTRQWIDSYQDQRFELSGRVPSRRLTNDQLQDTLCDLLSIDVPLARLMPDETRTDGFRNIADAQSMSHYHLEDHLLVVDAALDYAFDRAVGKIEADAVTFPADRIANKPKGRRNRDPELRQGAAVIWSCDMAFYGRISRTRIDQAGWYKITLDASSIKNPDGRNFWCSVRSGECTSRAPLMNWVGSFEPTPTPQTFTFNAWIEAGHLLEIKPTDNTLKKGRFKGGQVGYGEGESQNLPGLAMHELKIERVFPGGSIEDVRASLFGDLTLEFDDQNKTAVLKSQSPRRDVRQQIRRFASLAFRTSVSMEDLEPYLEPVSQVQFDGGGAVDALRQAYRAILCSPRFVYFREQPGRLDDDAVATRLSYMLTGKAPDERLRWAANSGKLSDPKVLVEQTRRLLADSQHLDHFVNDFADQWLDLADIDFTEPDRRTFRDFDLVIQDSMLQETRRFLKTLISENHPAVALVDADFTWLNSRLAQYYGIELDAEPSQWKRVPVGDHPYRGGLLTHGSVLKVTANGTNTSPVVRGVWICDRLLGIPIPDPPANVPAIEPDVRGAVTVRQILEKHRSQTECAACHARIDPPGFALEHFDAAGKWRDHYMKRSRGKLVPGPQVDSAYQLADGRKFDSFTQFRKLAADDDHLVARNFAAKLLTYATGHEITFADRKTLDAIVQQTKSDDHAIRSLIEAVVTSPTFLHK